MAIAGLLVHCRVEDAAELQKIISAMGGMTTYGIHDGQYIVVVAEAPGDLMEDAVARLDLLEGVLTIYTTYLTIEDELEAFGGV